MPCIRLVHTIGIVALLLGMVPVTVVAQTSSARAAPAGFSLEAVDGGVTLWRKRGEYVQMVSLKDGADIHLLHGKVIPSDGAGTNFARRNLREWWKGWKKEEPGALTLFNGQFFNVNNPSKSPLAFSTKINGIVYAGLGDTTEYDGQKMALRIADDSVEIEPYDDDAGSLYALPEKNIIVGLKPSVSKLGSVRRGRTFIGLKDDGNLMIFTSPAAMQRYAERILIAFGANRKKIMMLDGGGSTQLIYKGSLLIPTPKGKKALVLRTVPLAIGVMGGEDE